MNRVKRAVQAEAVYQMGYTGKGIRIAIIDTGAFLHRDIAGRVVQFVNYVNSWQECNDDNGHGTHIAGILCGNGFCSHGRVSGMAPEAELVVLKALDASGNGKTDKVLRALEWIMHYHSQYEIRIVNFSLGFLPGADDLEQQEIMCLLEELWDMGIAVVTAAGNNGPGAGSITVPGISRKVITVGASDDNLGGKGMPRGYSGKGPTPCCIVKPEILAPGTNILSLSNIGHRYVYKSGTSMATPVVSGALALALEKNPALRPEELKLKLYESTVAQKQLPSSWGILQVDSFMSLI